MMLMVGLYIATDQLHMVNVVKVVKVMCCGGWMAMS